MLHIINKSSIHVLISCLQIAQSKDAILLIEEGVFSSINQSRFIVMNNAEKQLDVFALKNDLEARGLLERVSPNIKLIDYDGFVDLTIQHTPIQTWS